MPYDLGKGMNLLQLTWYASRWKDSGLNGSAM